MPPALPLTLPSLQTARRALLLSGTPALSRPAELYTQMAAVDTSLNISFVDFGIRYCDGKRVGGAGSGGAGYVPQQLLPLPQNPWGWDFSGASHLEELQLYLQQRVMIRYASPHPFPSPHPPPPHTLPTPLPLATSSPSPHPPSQATEAGGAGAAPGQAPADGGHRAPHPKGQGTAADADPAQPRQYTQGGRVGGWGRYALWGDCVEVPLPSLSNWSSAALCCHCTSGQPISSSRPSSMSE